MSVRSLMWASLLAFQSLAMVFPSVCAGANPPDVNVVTFNDPDGVNNDLFGSSVAFSGDGSTALIGAFNAIESGVDGGKAYIYVRTDGAWPVNPTATFIDPAVRALDKFGSYVTLSADGSTALIGGASMTVYVYSKVNGAWSTAPSAVINDPDITDIGTYGDCFGCALALSADGNTALVGAFGVNENGINSVGKAYIFVRSNEVWSTVPVVTLSDPGSVKDDGFGYSVALSANGNVALIGTNHALAGGRAFVYSQNNGAWDTMPVAAFNISEPGEFNYDGSSVALSAAGDVALIGVRGVNNGTGVAYIYKAINGIWPTSPTVTFNDPIMTAGDNFGASIALSSDGTVAAIAGNSSLNLYVQSNGIWPAQPSSRLTIPNYAGVGGDGVALSSAGQAVLTGFPDPGDCVIPPPSPVPCQPPGPGQAFLFETSNDWFSPPPPPPASPPSGTASSTGGGAFGWPGLLLLSVLLCWMERRKHVAFHR